MHKKLYLPMALLMSLILGSGLAAFTNSNSASAQNYGYQDDYYGSSSYGDSSYSQYPTEDKKYECRTGPFEGFFVSSVEFCKHFKFDDRKDHKDRDNRTATSLYTVVGNTTAGSAGTANSTIVSTATCDLGDLTTGGSFIVTGNATIIASQPLATGNGYTATAVVFGNASIPGGSLGSVTADAICLDNPPLRP
jgi:large exoprotein involved in heme utilization and adhesion